LHDPCEDMGGKGKGKGKGKAVFDPKFKFQVKLSGEWTDYRPDEDAVLKRAYMVGQPNVRFSLRKHHYEYDFKNMTQKNMSTHKVREIRPPYGVQPPSSPLLAPGPMTVISVPPDLPAGSTITINDPNNPGQQVQVAVPPGAQPGAKIAVPLPNKGESVEDMKDRQKGHSTGAKVAMGAAGVAAVGGLAVGGVILGDHLTGGHLGTAGMVESTGDWVSGAAGDVADWTSTAAGDAADWTSTAAGDAGDWVTGDAADWASTAA